MAWWDDFATPIGTVQDDPEELERRRRQLLGLPDENPFGTSAPIVQPEPMAAPTVEPQNFIAAPQSPIPSEPIVNHDWLKQYAELDTDYYEQEIEAGRIDLSRMPAEADPLKYVINPEQEIQRASEIAFQKQPPADDPVSQRRLWAARREARTGHTSLVDVPSEVEGVTDRDLPRPIPITADGQIKRDAVEQGIIYGPVMGRYFRATPEGFDDARGQLSSAVLPGAMDVPPGTVLSYDEMEQFAAGQREAVQKGERIPLPQYQKQARFNELATPGTERTNQEAALLEKLFDYNGEFTERLESGQDPYTAMTSDAGREWAERVPIAGWIGKAGRAVDFAQVGKRIAENNATPEEIEQFALEVAREQFEATRHAARSFWEKRGVEAAAIARDMPTFMAEFLATAKPAELAASAAGRVAAKWVLPQAGKELVKRVTGNMAARMAASGVGRAALGTGKVAGRIGAATGRIGAQGAAQAALNPFMVAEHTASRLARELNIDADEQGHLKLVLEAPDEGLLEAAGKGYLDATIEFGSERAGFAIPGAGKVLGAALEKLPKAVKSAKLKELAVKAWTATGGSLADLSEKVLGKAGWHGVLGELYEERLGEVLRGATGVEDEFGATGGAVQAVGGIADVIRGSAGLIGVSDAELAEASAKAFWKDPKSPHYRGPLTDRDKELLKSLDLVQQGKKDFAEGGERAGQVVSEAAAFAIPGMASASAQTVANIALWSAKNRDAAKKLAEKDSFSRTDLETVGAVKDRSNAGRVPAEERERYPHLLKAILKEQERVAPAPAVQAGDLVQWESQGAEQFETPRRVTGVSDDGQWVFVEGSETGIPAGQVRATQPSRTPEDIADHQQLLASLDDQQLAEQRARYADSPELVAEVDAEIQRRQQPEEQQPVPEVVDQGQVPVATHVTVEEPVQTPEVVDQVDTQVDIPPAAVPDLLNQSMQPGEPSGRTSLGPQGPQAWEQATGKPAQAPAAPQTPPDAVQPPETTPEPPGQPEAAQERPEPPIVKFQQQAAEIEAALPPVPEGHTRLWRGNRPGEIGKNPQFTNSLPGIALPFAEAYKGELSYVDVPTADLPKYEQRVGAAPGAEFVVPSEIASTAQPVSERPPLPSDVVETAPGAAQTEAEQQASRAAERLGIKIERRKWSDRRRRGAFDPKNPNTVYVSDELAETSTDDADAYYGVVAHEMHHSLRRSDPKAWDEIASAIAEEDADGLAAEEEQYIADLERAGRKKKAALLRENAEERRNEGVSRYVQRRLDNREFVERLAGNKPGVFERILETLRKLLGGGNKLADRILSVWEGVAARQSGTLPTPEETAAAKQPVEGVEFGEQPDPEWLERVTRQPFASGKPKPPPMGESLRDKLPPHLQAEYDRMPDAVRKFHGISVLGETEAFEGFHEDEVSGARYDQRNNSLTLNRNASEQDQQEFFQNELLASWAFWNADQDFYNEWRKLRFPKGEPLKGGFAEYDQADAFARSVSEYLDGKTDPKLTAFFDGWFGKQPDAEPAPSAAPAPTDRVSSMSRKELTAEAKRLGVPLHSNTKVLRERVAEAMGRGAETAEPEAEAPAGPKPFKIDVIESPDIRRQRSRDIIESGQFKVGDRVKWTHSRSGEELTGTITGIDPKFMPNNVDVDVDQIAAPGGVPIGRIEHPMAVDLEKIEPELTQPESPSVQFKQPEPAEQTDEPDTQDTGRPGRLGAEGGEALAEAPPERGEVAGGDGGTVRRPRGSRGERGSDVRPTVEAGDESAGSRPDGGEGTPDTAGRPERPVVNAPGTDYRLRDASVIEQGGQKTKFKKNVAAIRLLKQLETENRRATPEEQDALAQFTGFGGLVQAFDAKNKGWSREYAELKDLLTEDEYASARRSTPNAHYTSPDVVRGIWAGLEAMGFEGGKVNEPALGSGLFFGLMPDGVYRNSQLHAVELDDLTGRIARQLYQNANIRISGFQKVAVPENHFDLFVSNVPFANVTMTDAHDRQLTNLRAPLHDYYFAKAIKATRPGGMIVFITSRFTLDKQGSKYRTAFADLGADLVGAVRLPKNAFAKIANTEVVTDIIVLQKREAGAEPAGEPFLSTVNLQQGGQSFLVNEYYELHPDHILGKLSYTGSMRGPDELTVEPDSSIDIPEAIRRIMGGFKARNVDHIAEATAEMSEPDYAAPAPTDLREGSLVVRDGKLIQKRGDQFVRVTAPRKGTPAVMERIGKMVELRDATRTLLNRQLDPTATDSEIEQARQELNRQYDAFVKKHGILNSNYNKSLFREDYDHPLLLSLEKYDEDEKTAEKAEIFTKRTQFPRTVPTSASTAEQALSISLAERGGIDLEFMSRLTGKPVGDIVGDLGTLVFERPDGGYEIESTYLSGNVRKKLQDAKRAGKRFQRNVEALEKVQPEDIAPADITVVPGASWVPSHDYEDFLRDTLGSVVKLRYVGGGEGAWTLDVKLAGNRAKLESDYGNPDISGLELMEKMMNHREIVVRRKDSDGNVYIDKDMTADSQAKAEKLRDEFQSWLWRDQARANRLLREYNDRFNNFVDPRFDGSHLVFPGMSEQWREQLRGYQRDNAWRIITTGNTLLAHAVGAGKTATIAAAVMEMRRLGQWRKPVIVVPNHMVEQWAGEFRQIYPSASILVADDLSPTKRQTVANRIATGNWDAVIFPQSAFEKIPISPDRMTDFFDRQIQALEQEITDAKAEAGDNRNFIKEMEKAKQRLEEMLNKLSAEWKKDKGPFFDELGVDALLVDEAHEFKNLYFRTRMGRVPGISPQLVQKSFDMLLKTEHVNEVTRGRGIVFATGTPVSNSMSELFTMQRYLQPGMLDSRDLAAFDSWATAFGQVVSDVEIEPTGGGFRVHSRFRRFINLPELMQMIRQVADVKTQRDLKLPRPPLSGGKAEVVVAPQSEELDAFVQSLVARAERVRSGGVKPSEDNMLKITTDGRKAALDMRLIDPLFPDLPDSKLNQAADNIHDIWEKTKKDRLLQIVWADLGTPGTQGFNVYAELKRKLVERGVSEKEIAFIHDADKSTKPARSRARAKLFRDARSGKIRVLVANTKKMSTGANIQKRLYAAHHLDAPWKPADVEQRDGRILRPGNESVNAKSSGGEVRVLRYVSKGSFDAYMWQTLETKQKFIEQVMRGDAGVREAEDVGEIMLNADEVKALAAGNPRIMDFVRVNAEVQKLSAEKRAFERDAFNRQMTLNGVPSQITAVENEIAAAKVDLDKYQAAVKDLPEDNQFRMTIGKRVFDSQKEAGDALMELLLEKSPNDYNSGFQAADLYGFPVHVRMSSATWGEREEGSSRKAAFFVRGEKAWSKEIGESGQGNIQRLLNVFRTDMPGFVNVGKDRVQKLQQQQKDLQDRVNQKFAKQKELDDKTTELRTIEAELNPKTGTQQIVEEADIERQRRKDAAEAPGFIAGPRKTRYDIVPDPIKASHPEVERRLQQAHGFKQPSWLERAKEAMLEGWHKVTRPQEHVPTRGKGAEKFARYNEFFRLLKAVPDSASDETNRTLAAVLDAVDGPQQLQVFERKLIYENLLRSIDAGQPLRFGFESREQVERELKKVDAVIADAKMKGVRKALANRETIRKELVQELVNLDLLDEKALDNDAYFHQQVTSKLLLDRLSGGTRPRPIKRAFQKQRYEGEKSLPEQFDYNTAYLEAEATWMAEARMEIAKHKLLRTMPDQMSRLKAEAKARNAEFKAKGIDKQVTWQEMLREHPDLAAWSPTPGNVFYPAFTIPEKVIAQLQKGIIDEATIRKSDLHDILAVGKARDPLILPKEVVAQLESMQTTLPGKLGEFFDTLHGLWKQWTLLYPKRALQYMLRNVTGDIDPVIGGAPGVLKPKYIGRAIREVHKFYYSKLALSDDLRKARDLHVIGGSMTAQDIPALKDLPLFRRFYREHPLREVGRAVTPHGMLANYFDRVKRFNEFRENLTRFAAFLYYRDALHAGGITHYGGANKATVDALKSSLGVDVAAAHLARNLLGDYANLTVMGQFLRRRLIPFWSFQEINLKRYPQLIINSVKAGQHRRGVLTGAVASTALLLRIGAMYAAFQLWNHLIHGDDEDELAGYDRSNPHVLLGRNPDGTINVFRNVGAIGDFLEWFGINDATNLLPQLASGQISLKDLAVEMGKSPVNKLVGGLRPEIKTTGELVTGKSVFPDVFTPRTIDRRDAVPDSLGLAEEFKWMRGKILGDGTRPRDHYWQRWFTGVTDPKVNAINEMHDLREKFLRKKGKGKDPFYTLSPFKPMREAAYNEDYDAFKEARAKYMAEGKSYESFKASLDKLDPISSRLSEEDELEFEQEFLSTKQRDRLSVARDYAHDLQVRMWQWWKTATLEEKGSTEDLDADVVRKMNTLSRVRPHRSHYRGPGSQEKWREAVQRWDDDVRTAREFLNDREINFDDAIKLWRSSDKKQGRLDVMRYNFNR